jgi:hypothetical protein
VSRRGTQVAWEGVRQWRSVRSVPVESYIHGSWNVRLCSMFKEVEAYPIV